MKTTSPIFNRNNQPVGTVNNIRGGKSLGPGDKKSAPLTGRQFFLFANAIFFILSSEILMKILMFSTHSMKYFNIQPQKVICLLYIRSGLI